MNRSEKWILHRAGWEKVILIGFFIAVSLTAFYNLEYSPRAWHDEGAIMSVSKTLVQDGVYAVRSSEGYQTFGPIQSAGPTVVLPVALSFKLLGIGIIQGRMVMAVYLLLALAVFYRLGRELFGPRAALLATVLLIGSPAVKFFFFGRQVAGEVPALTFFLGGWLVWLRGKRTGRPWLFLAAGLLIGMAMVTKSSYMPIGFATLTLLMILDRFFYRQGHIKALAVLGLVALVCVAAWIGWQLAYFGVDTFQENAAKLRQLASATTSFNLHAYSMTIKLLIGSDTGHFYYWWGFPALIYIGVLSSRRTRSSPVLAGLFVFASLWLGYYLLSVPWPTYLFAPAAVSALFVGKLWHDLVDGISIPLQTLWTEIREGRPARETLLGAASIALSLIVLYPLQNVLQFDVLARDQSPQHVAAYLNQTVDRDVVIETWERELAILTDHRYHFPDQSLLAKAHAASYRNPSQDYTLGASYFEIYQPSYLIVGWYARAVGIYSADFLAKYAHLVATIDDYQIYKLDLTSP